MADISRVISNVFYHLEHYLRIDVVCTKKSYKNLYNFT